MMDFFTLIVGGLAVFVAMTFLIVTMLLITISIAEAVEATKKSANTRTKVKASTRKRGK